jgi:transcriptional regulator with XRE-family HTH domain
MRTDRIVTPMDVWVGARFRAIRHAQGLTLQGMSEATGINRNRLSRMEQGNLVVTAGDVHRVASAFNRPCQWFFIGGGTAALRVPDEGNEPKEVSLAMAIPEFARTVRRLALLEGTDLALCMRIIGMVSREAERLTGT